MVTKSIGKIAVTKQFGESNNSVVVVARTEQTYTHKLDVCLSELPKEMKPKSTH